MSQAKCFKCARNVIDPFFCSKCKKPYHPSCGLQTGYNADGSYVKCCRPSPRSLSSSSATKSDSAVLKAIAELKVSFESRFDKVDSKLDHLGNRVLSNELEIQDLNKRVSNVEGKIQNLINAESKNIIARQCLVEVGNRERRKKNLVLFGFPEHESSTVLPNNNESNKNILRNSITDLFKRFVSINNLEDINTFRLGIIAQVSQLKPRPVKIICATEEKARVIRQMFVAAKGDLTHAHLLKNMWLNVDKTKMQVEEIAEKKNEFTARLQGGEEDLKLGYRNGYPVIMKKKNPLLQKSTAALVIT